MQSEAVTDLARSAIPWGAVVIMFIWLCYTLWVGEFRIRGRSDPFTRRHNPREYWIATATLAFVMILIVIVFLNWR